METEQRYNFKTIEEKWQKFWEGNKTFQTKIDNSTKNNFDSTTIEETPAKTGDRKHKSQRIGKFGRFLGYAIIAALSALTTLLFL